MLSATSEFPALSCYCNFPSGAILTVEHNDFHDVTMPSINSCARQSIKRDFLYRHENGGSGDQ